MLDFDFDAPFDNTEYFNYFLENYRRVRSSGMGSTTFIFDTMIWQREEEENMPFHKVDMIKSSAQHLLRCHPFNIQCERSEMVVTYRGVKLDYRADAWDGLQYIYENVDAATYEDMIHVMVNNCDGQWHLM